MSTYKIQKVISGGQTGIDRAGLEAAKEADVQTGGTAPGNFMTCDGADLELRDEFNLIKLPNSDKMSVSQQYVKRSMKNVDDADAVIVFKLKSSVGTDKTIGYAQTGRWCEPTPVNPVNSHRPICVIGPDFCWNQPA